MVGHGGSSAGSYLADPTSPIPSHCASIVGTSTLRVKHFFMKLFLLQIHLAMVELRACIQTPSMSHYVKWTSRLFFMETYWNSNITKQICVFIKLQMVRKVAKSKSLTSHCYLQDSNLRQNSVKKKLKDIMLLYIQECIILKVDLCFLTKLRLKKKTSS